MKTASVSCRFCQARVGAEDGDLDKIDRHLENSHDIYHERHLAMLLCFISDQEILTISEKLQSRVESFKKQGVIEYGESIFTVEEVKPSININPIDPAAEIFTLLDSDEEDDVIEVISDEQVQPPEQERRKDQRRSSSPRDRARRRIFSEDLRDSSSNTFQFNNEEVLRSTADDVRSPTARVH